MSVREPIVQPGLGSFEPLRLASPAFANGARLPERFTADGEGTYAGGAGVDGDDDRIGSGSIRHGETMYAV